LRGRNRIEGFGKPSKFATGITKNDGRAIPSFS
jgi:hypothetical protein